MMILAFTSHASQIKKIVVIDHYIRLSPFKGKYHQNTHNDMWFHPAKRSFLYIDGVDEL